MFGSRKIYVNNSAWYFGAENPTALAIARIDNLCSLGLIAEEEALFIMDRLYTVEDSLTPEDDSDNSTSTRAPPY